MPIIRYITHPNVEVDPETDVTAWRLSNDGRARAEAMLDQPWVGSLRRVICSAETKAVETAHVLSSHLGFDFEVRADSGENDRSATGFRPQREFERLADLFFREPAQSVQGWERAIDAQARIVTALGDLLDEGAPPLDTAVIGHGAVGTLWYCALAGLPISRAEDQPYQGHNYSVDIDSSAPLHRWRPIEPGAPTSPTE